MTPIEAYRAHVNPTLALLEDGAGISRDFVRAEGCRLWDSIGREYLDFGAGHGTFSLGHYDPELVAGVIGEMERQPLQIHSLGPSGHMGELARLMVALMGAPYEIAFFSNSGTEAVEGALKLARAATGRRKFVHCSCAYHGTSMGSLSAMAAGPLRDAFEPLLAEFVAIRYNDLAGLRGALEGHDVAAFIVEPIPCEGGVLMPSGAFLEESVRLCREAETLSIFDEVQTGLGRTGRLFAYEHWATKPDIVATGKALGGGLLPIGAYITSREIQDRAYGTFLTCAIHHSTFGGNSLCCKAAVMALSKLAAPAMLARTQAQGGVLLEELVQRFSGHPLVRDVRGKGLLIGIEFLHPDHPWLFWENMGLPEFRGLNSVPFLVMRELLKGGIITHVCAHNWNVLKIEPPLIIQPEHLARFCSCLERAIARIVERLE